MKTGWAVAAVGIAVSVVGVTLFGRYVLAFENWPAIVTSLVGLSLVAFGFRTARGVAGSRSILFAFGVFLLMIAGYALFRVEWRIWAAPQLLLLAVAGVALIFIGGRQARGTAVRTPTV